MLRITKIGLVIAVALWGLVGGALNLMDWPGTLAAVRAATSMVTIEGGADSWRATSNGFVVWSGALFIMLSKFLAALLCAVSAMRMWQARTSDAQSFAAAKSLALAGCAVAVIMLFGGFIVIAESWFELWASDVMRAPVLDSAFRYAGMIMLIALFVGAKND